MTRDELRKELLCVLVNIRYQIDYGDEIIDMIIETFRKAGWKSPEEVEELGNSIYKQGVFDGYHSTVLKQEMGKLL